MGKPDKMTAYSNIVLYVQGKDKLGAMRCLDEVLQQYRGADLSDILDWIRNDLKDQAPPLITEYLTERRAVRVGALEPSQLDAVEAKLQEWR